MSVFFACFYAKTCLTIQKLGNFYILSFFNSSDLGFEIKNFFLQFLVDIFPLGSGSVDPHIFADPDPGSQNLADPTDPDPKHSSAAVYPNLLLYIATYYITSLPAAYIFQHTAIYPYLPLCFLTYCNISQPTAIYPNLLLYIPTYCYISPFTAIHL